MRSLTPLPDDPAYLDWYVSIRDKKHEATRTPLIAAHALIEGRYKAHAEAIGNGSLGSLAQHAESLLPRDALRACYNGVTQPLEQLKKAIRDAQPKRVLKYCPMCGTTLPRTFDHYMPAVTFPEFAVHPLNLVPCCSTCNSTKGDDWLSTAGRRQFLHAYTDDLPNQQFIKATLHEDRLLAGVGATFLLERPAKVADDLWELISSHFRRLKLIERYDERGNDEVAEILSGCRAFLNAGGQDVRKFLSECAIERRAVYGANHWIAVLMKTMADHPNLEAWCALHNDVQGNRHELTVKEHG
jgi:5-methylcytosine-specific restriction endonuclease McrA